MKITASICTIFKRELLGKKQAFRTLKACVDSGLPVGGHLLRENVHLCEPTCRAMERKKLVVFENKRSVYIEVESRCCCCQSESRDRHEVRSNGRRSPLFALSIGPTFNCLWGRSTRLPLLLSVA